MSNNTKAFSYKKNRDNDKIKNKFPFVHIENVDFSYGNNDKKIITKLNLDINEGKFIGIAGPSGCGKSFFIKLLTKLEKNTAGHIIIDGKNLENLSRKDISGMMALVPQNPFLVVGTIKENICYGIHRKVSEEEIKEAAKKAYIDDFIETLLNGYKRW